MALHFAKRITEYKLAKELLTRGKDIILSPEAQVLKTFVQHGETTVFEHCLSVANRRTGVISAASQWTQTLKINLEEMIDGNTIYADGKGGCYFVRDVYGATADASGEVPKETIYPEVEYHEDTQTATLKFPYIEKSTKVETTAVQEVFFYDKTLAAGTAMPGPNNLDYGAYSGANGASKFLGATSDELAYTTFDVTVKSNTPAGTYYIALDDSRLNQVTTVDWKAYDPSNIEVNYGDAGVVLGYNKNDSAKKEVQGAAQ